MKHSINWSMIIVRVEGISIEITKHVPFAGKINLLLCFSTSQMKMFSFIFDHTNFVLSLAGLRRRFFPVKMALERAPTTPGLEG